MTDWGYIIGGWAFIAVMAGMIFAVASEIGGLLGGVAALIGISAFAVGRAYFEMKEIGVIGDGT